MALPPLKINVTANTAGAEAALNRTEAALVSTGNAATVAGTKMRSASGHTANLAAQFNDIGVMLAAGQSPLMLAVQQGTQINQVFAQLGGGGSAIRALGGAFKSMINPLSLATIAVIAGGAALVQWGISALGASDEAKKLAESLKEIEENAAAAEDRLRRARLGVSAEELQATDALAAKVAEINQLRADMATMDNRQLRNARSTLQLREEERAKLQQQLDTIRAAQQEVRLLDDGLSQAAVEALKIAGIDLAKPISDAARSAAMLAAQTGIAYENARNIMFLRETQNRYSGRGGDPRQFDTEGRLGGGFVASSGIVSAANDLLNPSRSGGGSSGGGSGMSNGLGALVDSLQTEREVLQEWYSESLELLQNASDAELEALGGKHAAMQRLEAEHQDRMKAITKDGSSGALGIYKQYGSQILSAMGATGEQMALINAAIGASQALADPTIPFWGKFAAVAQVLAAGNSLASQAGGGGAAASVSSVARQEIVTTRNVNINLQGGSISDQKLIRHVIEQMNEAMGDGARINAMGA